MGRIYNLLENERYGEGPRTGKNGEFGCQGPAVWQNTEEEEAPFANQSLSISFHLSPRLQTAIMAYTRVPIVISHPVDIVISHPVDIVTSTL